MAVKKNNDDDVLHKLGFDAGNFIMDGNTNYTKISLEELTLINIIKLYLVMGLLEVACWKRLKEKQ